MHGKVRLLKVAFSKAQSITQVTGQTESQVTKENERKKIRPVKYKSVPPTREWQQRAWSSLKTKILNGSKSQKKKVQKWTHYLKSQRGNFFGLSCSDPKCLEMIPVLLSGLFVMNQVRQGRNNPNLFYKPTLALCPPWNVVLLIYFPRERGPRGKWFQDILLVLKYSKASRELKFYPGKISREKLLYISNPNHSTINSHCG